MALTATCLTLAAVLAQAKAGSTVIVQPASTSCPPVFIEGVRFEGASVLVEAGDTVFENGLRIRGSSGITIRGGIFNSLPDPTPYTVHVRTSERIRLEKGRYTKALRGLVVGKSTDIEVIDGRFFSLGAEGVNLAGVDRFVVRGNEMTDFSPRPTRCTLADGTVEERLSRSHCEGKGGQWKDGNHPDCIQFWGGTRNGLVENNRCIGHMQGIFGPADNVLIRNNFVQVSFGNAIRSTGTGNRVIGNTIEAYGKPRFTPRIYLRGENNLACGNTVRTGASPEAQRACSPQELSQ